jgi:uncharacterized protein YndB with AHSA1/START domain
MHLNVETVIAAPIDAVWEGYTNPQQVMEWNAASPEWHCPVAENDLRPGGRFTYRMEARDGSEGFDFGGVYDEVVVHERIAYTMDDGRRAVVNFAHEGEGVRVTVQFEPEAENTHELQQAGWQSILDNFKQYLEQAH